MWAVRTTSSKREELNTEVITSLKIEFAWAVAVTTARPPTEDTKIPSPNGPGTVDSSIWNSIKYIGFNETLY